MKQRILKLSLLLLAGAIINVAVAWGCALWSKPAPPSNPSGIQLALQRDSKLNSCQRYGLFREKLGAQIEFRQTHLLTGPGIDIHRLHWVSQKYDQRGVLVYWIDDQWVDAVDAPEFVSQDYDLYWYSAGLPMLSMQGGQWTTQDHPFVDQSPTRWLSRGFWVRGKSPRSDADLQICSFVPLCPVWPGFIINTILYAAVLWLLLFNPFLPGRIRRRYRIKRGLCPACAYPVGSSDKCTECGKPVTPRSVEIVK